MPKRKALKDLSEAELKVQAQKFTAEERDVVFISAERNWKAEIHPELEK